MISFSKTGFCFTAVMIFFTLLVFLRFHRKTLPTASVSSDQDTFTVVIDAGHGGFDSGKVGIDGTLEKDINLSIAQKLEKLLTAADVKVIMTREDEHGLYEETSSNKKRQDMTRRAQRMNESNADCIVSIHQNSYPDEAVKGAQVFYRTSSESGKTLACLIQKQLVEGVDPDNHRIEKSNNTYYLLKNVSAPLVIVECGFLSNWEESKKIADDAYQQKLAWAIHLGILQYLNGVTINSHTLR